MKRSFAFSAGAVLTLLAGTVLAKAGKTNWEAKGKYYETCGCAVSCPCGTGEFKPTEAHCDAISALHFDKASYGKTKLDGLNVAIVFQSPKNQKVLDAFNKGEMDHFAIYLDDKASDEQKAALGPFLEALFGKMEIKGAKPPAFAPIKIEGDDDRASIDVANGKLTANIVNFKLGETKDGKKSVAKRYKIEGASPWPWIPVVTQGKSTQFHYAEGAIKWDYKERNAFFGEFKTKGTASAEPAKAN
jgi:hypothetical protein